MKPEQATALIDSTKQAIRMANAERQAAQGRVEAADIAKQQAQKERDDALKRERTSSVRLGRLMHLASGKCLAFVIDGSSWSRTYRYCNNTGKQECDTCGGRMCGTHARHHRCLEEPALSSWDLKKKS